MSIEDRLFALAQQYLGQHGAAGVTDQATLISQLSTQAPDLHAEIRALAAAFSVNAGPRIKAAGNADLEAQGIAGEIAASQKLAMATVTPAIAVVRRLDVAAAVQTPPSPADAGWAGDSVVVGAGAAPPVPPVPPAMPPVPSLQPGVAAPTAQAAPADKPVWQNKWAIGGVAAVAALLAYQHFAGPTPRNGPTGVGTDAPTVGPTSAPTIGPINPTGPPAQPPSPNAGGALPELASPNGPLPTLMVRSQGQGFLVGFSFRGAAGVVVAPDGGWDRGPGMIAFARTPQAERPDSAGGGMFQRVNSSQGPSRLMRVQWQQDGMNVGPMCVAFVGSGGPDVNPSGSRLCVLDGGCSQAVACGQLPVANQQSAPPSGSGLPGGGMQPGQ